MTATNQAAIAYFECLSCKGEGGSYCNDYWTSGDICGRHWEACGHCDGSGVISEGELMERERAAIKQSRESNVSMARLSGVGVGTGVVILIAALTGLMAALYTDGMLGDVAKSADSTWARCSRRISE